MKTRKVIVEMICFVLLMFWFYEGVYKLAYWGNYGLWMRHAPLLKPVWQILTYVIPIGEIALALAFLFPSQRTKALYITIGALMIFVFWIMSVFLLTNRLFWPYHALWPKPTWIQKMLISMGLCWSTFVAMIFYTAKSKFKKNDSNFLRNMPANAR